MKIFVHKDMNKIDVLDERFYQVGDTYYPSVTTVLQSYPKGYWYDAWLKDAGKNADTIRDAAAEKGTKVHNAIEDILVGREVTWIINGKPMYTIEEWQRICRYMDFHARYVVKGERVASETQLFSKKMRLGGTCDMVVKIDGQVWLIDFKTSNSLYKTNELQLAVYKEMWDEKNLPKIDRYGVLWLNAATRADKEFQGKGWQLKEFTDKHEHNIKLFNHTRALWDEENPNYAPKNLSYPNTIKLTA